MPVDVAESDQIEAAAEKIEAELGPIHIRINDAMASVFSPVKEMEPVEFRRVTEVTYLRCGGGTLEALKRMLPRNRGAIVQVGSALAHRGIRLQSANRVRRDRNCGLTFPAPERRALTRGHAMRRRNSQGSRGGCK